ncbi:hypothetical protein [Streptomyces sp. NPDC046862]|uniref:hypothetical protein n=1 Tax=Streptomyces sp. NPDC046862 TaxID=3154603 RepID=UPI003453E351
MPRKRPKRVRAALRSPDRSHGTRPVIDGLSARVLTEIALLERSRNHLQSGDVATAVRLWHDCVHRPARGQWHEYEFGNDHAYCCGDPLEARALLDTVLNALSPRGARELRKVVGRLDALWIPPS